MTPQNKGTLVYRDSIEIFRVKGFPKIKISGTILGIPIVIVRMI